MTEKAYLVKLVLGDDSGDEHGITKEMKYTSNYDRDTIWKAYMDSCKKTGIQFNHNENYTGLPDLEDWQQVFTEYGDCYMDKRTEDVLRQHGIDPAQYGDDDDGDLYFDEDGAAGLIMAFIALSMPEDWTCTPVEDDFEIINDPQFGYGLLG